MDRAVVVLDTHTVPPARLGRRMWARWIDGLLVSILIALIGGTVFRFNVDFPLGRRGAFTLAGFSVVVAYEVSFLLVCGATPGKRLIGIEVVDAATGGPMKPRQAIARGAAWPIGLVVPFGVVILWLTALRDPRRRGLHDRLCGTAPVLLTDAPRRSILKVMAVWIAAVTVLALVQTSRPALASSQATEGAVSVDALPGRPAASVLRARSTEVVLTVEPVTRGLFQLETTDVTLPDSAPFELVSTERLSHGHLRLRLRARSCGSNRELAALVLHARLGPLSVQRTAGLLVGILPADCAA